MRIRSCFYGQMLGSSSISIRVMRIKMKKSMYFIFFNYVLYGFTRIKLSLSDRSIPREVYRVKYIALKVLLVVVP